MKSINWRAAAVEALFAMVSAYATLWFMSWLGLTFSSGVPAVGLATGIAFAAHVNGQLSARRSPPP